MRSVYASTRSESRSTSCRSVNTRRCAPPTNGMLEPGPSASSQAGQPAGDDHLYELPNFTERARPTCRRQLALCPRQPRRLAASAHAAARPHGIGRHISGRDLALLAPHGVHQHEQPDAGWVLSGASSVKGARRQRSSTLWSTAPMPSVMGRHEIDKAVPGACLRPLGALYSLLDRTRPDLHRRIPESPSTPASLAQPPTTRTLHPRAHPQR